MSWHHVDDRGVGVRIRGRIPGGGVPDPDLNRGRTTDRIDDGTRLRRRRRRRRPAPGHPDGHAPSLLDAGPGRDHALPRHPHRRSIRRERRGLRRGCLPRTTGKGSGRGRGRGREQARVGARRAFRVVRCRGAFPATVVIAISRSSGLARARAIASASSWPGSQSRTIGVLATAEGERSRPASSGPPTRRRRSADSLAVPRPRSLGCAQRCAGRAHRIPAGAIPGQLTVVDGSVLDLEEETCASAPLD